MKFNSKILLPALTGLAIVSGAGYYIYIRRKDMINSIEYQLCQLRDIVYEYQSADINQIKLIFNKSYQIYQQKVSLEDNLSNVEEETIRYFSDLFYVLIDGQADFLDQFSHCRQFNNLNILKKEQLFDQYNILIANLLDLIADLLNSNKFYGKIFSQIIQQTFNSPIRYSISLEKYELLDNKIINKEITIFEYLLINQIFLNEFNMQLFCQILQKLIQYDSQLQNFINLKYTKLFKFAIISTDMLDKHNKVFETYEVTQISKLCTNKFIIKCNSQNTVIVNEDILINSIKLIHQYINYAHSNPQIFQILGSYIQNIFSQMNNLENFIKLEEFIEELLDLQEKVFENVQVKSQQEQNALDYLAVNIERIMSYIALQITLYDIQNNLTYLCCQRLSKNKKDQILKIICQNYKKQIDNFFNQSLLHKENTREESNYIGYSIACLLIHIIILSDASDLSAVSIRYLIEYNFELKNQFEVDDFINKIAYVLHCDLISYSFHYNGLLLHQFIESQSRMPEQQQAYLQNIWSQLLSASNGVYDMNTLAYQFITSVQINSQQLIYKFLSHYHFQFRNQSIFEQVHIIKPQRILKNILYDQTPLINIDIKMKKLLSSKNNGIQFSSQNAVNQVISSIILLNNQNPITIEQLSQQMTECIFDQEIIDSSLKSFGSYSEIDENILSILHNDKEQPPNIGRQFNNHLDLVLQQTKYKGIYQNLYKFQQDLMINSFFTQQLLDLFIEKLSVCSINNNLCKDMLLAFDLYLLIWSELIQLQDIDQQIFNEEQNAQIIEFKNLLLTQDNYYLFQPQLSYLINNFEENQFYIPEGAQNLYRLFEKIDKLKSKSIQS